MAGESYMYVQKALFGSSAFKGVRNHFWIVICELPDRFCVLKVLNFGFRAVFLYKKKITAFDSNLEIRQRQINQRSHTIFRDDIARL